MSTSELDRPVFGSRGAGVGGQTDYAAVQRSPEFQTLRRKQRMFVFPVSIFFMAWFLVYVLLSAYAHAFMARPVLGLINVGILMGLAQFVTTVLIMIGYCRYADRTLDPLADELRERAGNQS